MKMSRSLFRRNRHTRMIPVVQQVGGCLVLSAFHLLLSHLQAREHSCILQSMRKLKMIISGEARTEMELQVLPVVSDVLEKLMQMSKTDTTR